jgi:hypothetical protein
MSSTVWFIWSANLFLLFWGEQLHAPARGKVHGVISASFSAACFDDAPLSNGTESRSMTAGRPRLPVMFAIPRTVGWLAQWQEMITDPEQKITRPRQIFVGQQHRELVMQKV